jgi:hypothetical protein
MSMSKLKIGITTRDEASIWSNGLDQNIYFLYKMLEDMNYEPYLISEYQNASKLLDIPVMILNYENIKTFDLILEIAHVLGDNFCNYFNSLGRPVVGIKYGNNFMMDLERYISSDSKFISQATGTNLPFRNRELWVSEQFYKFKDYYGVFARCEVKVIPYIWEPTILKMNDDGFHLNSINLKKEDLKKIAIVEPNINIVKNCITPLAICEMAYDKNPSLIKEVYCFGSKHLDKNNIFLNYLKYLNIHRDKISSYEARYPIFKMFKNNLANTIVSHQLFNEQNYVYLEALFYKRPLIHNSPMFKDVGFYYPDYDVKEGSRQLLEAIESFDQIKIAESYESKINHHSIYNKINQEKTRELIESVIK